MSSPQETGPQAGRDPVQALVALSSNLGDRRKNLDGALQALEETPGVRVLRASPWIETEAVGGPEDQPAYLNGAAAVESAIEARDLLDRLLEIEKAHGRERAEGVKDAPRTLDLDLLFFGTQVIREPGLIVPHPRLESRTFVLEPLVKVAPHHFLPGCRRSVMERLSELRMRARWRKRAPA